MGKKAKRDAKREAQEATERKQKDFDDNHFEVNEWFGGKKYIKKKYILDYIGAKPVPRFVTWLKITFMLLVFCIAMMHKSMRTPAIPEHLLNHPAKFIPEMLTAEQAAHLRSLVKNMADFPSNTQDTEFYDVIYEHVGEAEPISENGTCTHPYLIPNKKRDLCVLPGRIDIGRHFMKYGGVEGMKESFLVSSSRVQSFGRYIFDLQHFPKVKELFESERFLKEAIEICPSHKQVLDPFQFNFIMQIPGQSVAYHLDAVYFEDATRFQYPQWLLAVMKQSGLYEEKFIDQVQKRLPFLPVVGYFHEWNSTERGGQFIYHLTNSLDPYKEQPMPQAGSMVDGAKVIHASTIYMPERKPPPLITTKNNRLMYKGNDVWAVYSDGKRIATYNTDDLRMTIVFRARCFETEEKRKRFNDWYRTVDRVKPVNNILEELKADLVKRGYKKDWMSKLSKFDFSMLLLDVYIAYPWPMTSFIPYNYCLLPKLYPWTSHIFSWIC